MLPPWGPRLTQRALAYLYNSRYYYLYNLTHRKGLYYFLWVAVLAVVSGIVSSIGNRKCPVAVQHITVCLDSRKGKKGKKVGRRRW